MVNDVFNKTFKTVNFDDLTVRLKKLLFITRNLMAVNFQLFQVAQNRT